MNPGPRVVALVGSPRRTGNTVFAVGVATQELERRGVSSETILICDLPISLNAPEAGQQKRTSAEEQLEAVLDRVWAADALILATPIHFSNVSAQMKAFMDATNDRYMMERWLTPQAVGLMVIGAHVFTSTVDAMRRYVDAHRARPPARLRGHRPCRRRRGSAAVRGSPHVGSDHGRTHSRHPAGLITGASPGRRWTRPGHLPARC